MQIKNWQVTTLTKPEKNTKTEKAHEVLERKERK